VTNAPIDATTTSAWAELESLKAGFTPDLRGWFAADPERVSKLTHDVGDLHVDLSKNLVTDEIVAALVRLAEQTGVAERYAASTSTRPRTGRCCTPPSAVPPTRRRR